MIINSFLETILRSFLVHMFNLLLFLDHFLSRLCYTLLSITKSPAELEKGHLALMLATFHDDEEQNQVAVVVIVANNSGDVCCVTSPR